MLKAIGSKTNLLCKETPNAYEFMECIKDIYFNAKVQKLDEWQQHNHTSRLQHSLNVSYYSYVICKTFGWDYKSAARAAMLHDLYFYDWRKKSALRKQNHSLWHSLVEVENAKKITVLNSIEEDAIKKHEEVYEKSEEEHQKIEQEKKQAEFELLVESIVLKVLEKMNGTGEEETTPKEPVEEEKGQERASIDYSEFEKRIANLK